MDISLGIVGLPNVGKSTLFNALTNNGIPAENYPFCTIDPNVGVVPVADHKLDALAALVKPEKITPAVIQFYDIAGLVRGAHKGEGLGNEFLTHIRNTNAIVHVVRAFAGSDVIHVENRIDPKSDKEIVETELILKDLDSLEKKLPRLQSEVKQDKGMQKFITLLEGLKKHLEAGHLAITFAADEADKDIQKYRRELFLLTDKPVIYVINTHEENPDLAKIRADLQLEEGFPVIALDVKQEYEISLLNAEDKALFRQELGLKFTGLEELTKACYELLGLISFYTAGPKEVRAWTITRGMTAPQAAGVIHTDFEHKFIAAEIAAFDDFIAFGGWTGVKEKGKVRLEGKEYVMKDNDVVLFRHGA